MTYLFTIEDRPLLKAIIEKDIDFLGDSSILVKIMLLHEERSDYLFEEAVL